MQEAGALAHFRGAKQSGSADGRRASDIFYFLI